jgi:hypothetical protein
MAGIDGRPRIAAPIRYGTLCSRLYQSKGAGTAPVEKQLIMFENNKLRGLLDLGRAHGHTRTG